MATDHRPRLYRRDWGAYMRRISGDFMFGSSETR